MSNKKKRNLKICYPAFGQEQPPKKRVKILIQNTVTSLTYNSLCIGYRQKTVKPNRIRFVQQHPKLRHSLKLFRRIARNAKHFCKQYRKDFDVYKELNLIIPFEFFGCREHKKNFYRIVKKLISHSSHECVYAKSVIYRFKFKSVSWLNNFNNNHMLWRRYWYYGNIWLLEKIVKPIVNKYLYSLKDNRSYEVKYIPKHLWYSYEAKIFNKLKELNWITEANDYEFSVRGTLRVLPKNGLKDYEKFRLIMKPKNQRTSLQKKRRMIIFKYASKIGCAQRANLYEAWKNYLCRAGKQKIYAAKIDVSDAYGNVNIDDLKRVITRLSDYPVQIGMALINYLKNQYITLRSPEHKAKIFKWQHGLLQGDYLSSAFCELYMSYMDNKYLKEFCKSTTLLHRTVDDYFFCSTNPKDIPRFISVMMAVHIVNTEKTQSTETPYCNTEIEYCGRLINIKTKEIGSLYKFKENISLRYRFKLFNKDRALAKENFLIRAMYYPYNNYHFNKIVLNTIYNSEDKVLQNFFHAMIYLAYKFDAAVMAIYQEEKMLFYGQVIADTLWYYSQQSLANIYKFKGENNIGSIKFLALVKIGYQAFLLVLRRRSLKYKFLLQEIKRVNALIYLNYYKPNDFKQLPACFRAIRMSRVLNIVDQ